MSLTEIVQTDIISLPPDVSQIDAASLMRRRKIGSVFVREKEAYIGIVTEGDLVRKGLANAVPSQTRIDRLMTSPILDIDFQRSVLEANHLMHFNGIRHLAVSKEGRIIGIISVRDLVRYFSRQDNGPAQSLNDIYQPLSVLLHREIVGITLETSVQKSAKLLGEKKIGCLVVMDESLPMGIITETDLVRKVIGFGLNPEQTPVGAIMNVPIIDIDINRSISDASQMMASRGVRHLAVSEQGKIVGILSIRDLIGMISIRDLPRFFSHQQGSAQSKKA